MVAFDGAAPTSGETIKLSSSDAALAAVPASVRILSGKLTATFTVNHRRTNTTTTVVLTATYGGVSHTAQLTLEPFQITSLVLAPSSVIGGKTTTGTVTLNAIPGSGAGSVVVKLAYSGKAVSGAASVIVPLGKNSGKVALRTAKVTASQTVTVTGSITGSSNSASLTVTQ
jgi:hypothetical protein